MRALNRLLLTTVLLANSAILFAETPCKDCCDHHGAVHYCDSSAGRYVCTDGNYSECYCTIHAVMDLQKIQGCCLWQGGVLKIDDKGLVMCRNGGLSEICTLQVPVQSAAVF